MTMQNPWNICRVFVLNPTSPSLACSIDGVSKLRAGVVSSGRPPM